jgi:formiminotetrahydrofolate cyclodeaminase
MKYGFFEEYLNALAAKAPTPGGGGVAALNAALAASLLQMVLAYSRSKMPAAVAEMAEQLALQCQRSVRRCLVLMEEDEQVFTSLRTLWQEREDAQAKLDNAYLAAAAPGVEILEIVYGLSEQLRQISPHTKASLRSDLEIVVANFMAAAAAATSNVFINGRALHDKPKREQLLSSAMTRKQDISENCEVIAQT